MENRAAPLSGQAGRRCAQNTTEETHDLPGQRAGPAPEAWAPPAPSTEVTAEGEALSPSDPPLLSSPPGGRQDQARGLTRPRRLSAT